MGSSDELMFEARQRAMDERIAKYLGITPDEYEDLQVEVQPQTSNDEGLAGYYIELPDDAPDEILEKLGRAPGETVYLPLNLFDEPEEP